MADAPSQPNRKRILLIEDEPRTRIVLWDKLRIAGFDIELAPNGHLALEKLRNARFDAIFMDLLLPFVKGVEVIREARRIKNFGEHPIYVCTSAALMNVWTKRGTNAGATRVFDKAATPVDDIVAEVAADLLGHRRPETRKPVPVGNPSKAQPAKPLKFKPEKPSRAKSILRTIASMRLSSITKGLLGRSDKKALAPPTPKTTAKGAPPTAPTAQTPAPAAEQGPPAASEPNPVAPPPPTQTKTRTQSQTPAAPSAEPAPATSIRAAIPSATGSSVLTLDGSGTITAAEGACAIMFGWESLDLVGKPLKILVKETLVTQLEQFMKPGAAASGNQPSSLKVVARRKNGTEFPASITRLAWSSDTSMTGKSGASASWTAVFRDLSVAAHPLPPASVAAAAQQQNRAPEAAGSSARETVSLLEQTEARMDQANQELRRQFESLAIEAARNREALANAQNECHQLSGKVDSHDTELVLARTALEREIESRNLLEQQLQTLTRLKADLEAQVAAQREAMQNVSAQMRQQLDEAKHAYESEAARAQGLERELTRLRETQDQLTSRTTAEQNAAADFKQQAEQLESRLGVLTAEIARLKSELENQAAERQRFEAEWQQQLNTAKAAAEKAEGAWAEEVARNKQFEERLRGLTNSLKQEQVDRAKRFGEELTELRQSRDELKAKLATEQQAGAESKRKSEEFERQLRASAAEVERVRTDKEKQAAEQQRLEAEFRKQLESAESLSRKLEGALLAAAERSKRFEDELAGLRQSRDELHARLAAEQAAAAESKRRIEELDRQLRQNAAELERVKAELAKVERGHPFEHKLANLQQQRDELSGKLTSEHQVTEQSRQRSQELEGRLRDNTAELDRVKADREKHAREQATLETELRSQLSTAKSAAERAETALQAKVAQCRQYEQQLSGLQQARGELEGKLATLRQAAAESKSRSRDLENRMRESAAELERLKAEREKQASEQATLESALQGQLADAQSAARRAEAACREESARCQSLEQEQASLRQERDAVKAMLAAEKQATAELTRRNEELDRIHRAGASELKRLKEEAESRAHDRASMDSELRAELETFKTRAARAEGDVAALSTRHSTLEAALLEESERNRQWEEEAAHLREERDEFRSQWAAELQACDDFKARIRELEARLQESADAFARLRAETDERAQDTRLELDLRQQLHDAKAAAKDAEAALKSLQQETENLRRERLDLCDKITAEKQSSVKTKRRVKELEKQLRDIASGFATSKVELERRAAERSRATGDLMAELESARAAAAQTEADRQEQIERCRSLEKELAETKLARNESEFKVESLESRVSQLSATASQLEERLRTNAAELGRTKAALEHHTEFQSQQAEVTHSTELGKELCRLRENEAAHNAEVGELERRVRDSVGSLARITADLEKERAERRRVEQRVTTLTEQLESLHEELRKNLESQRATQARVTELEENLQERQDDVSRINADLQKEQSDLQLAEEQLRAVGDMSAQLRQYLSLFEESKKVFKRTQDELEARLQNSLAALSESEARVASLTARHATLEEALAAAQRNIHAQTEQKALELARLESELQVEQFERKRLEGDAQQSRLATLDSTRIARTMVNNFRRQIREPVENVMQSTRRLLECDLAEPQKKLVENVLENALLVQTSLHESGAPNASSARNVEQLDAAA